MLSETRGWTAISSVTLSLSAALPIKKSKQSGFTGLHAWLLPVLQFHPKLQPWCFENMCHGDLIFLGRHVSLVMSSRPGEACLLSDFIWICGCGAGVP